MIYKVIKYQQRGMEFLSILDTSVLCVDTRWIISFAVVIGVDLMSFSEVCKPKGDKLVISSVDVCMELLCFTVGSDFGWLDNPAPVYDKKNTSSDGI